MHNYIIEVITALELMRGAAEEKDSAGNDVPLLCSGGAVTSSPSAPCGGEHSRRPVYCKCVFFGFCVNTTVMVYVAE